MKINSIQTITTKCTTYDAEERSKMSKEEIYQDMMSRPNPLAHCSYMGFEFRVYDISCVNGEKMLTGILNDDKFPSTISLEEVTSNDMELFVLEEAFDKILYCPGCPNLPKPL